MNKGGGSIFSQASFQVGIEEAAHDHDRHRTRFRPYRPQQVTPRHLRHPIVCQYQVDPVLVLEKPSQTFAPRRREKQCVPTRCQKLVRNVAQCLFVFDEQNRFRSPLNIPGIRSRFLLSLVLSFGNREIHAEGRADSRGRLHIDEPAMLLHHTVGDRETESRPLPFCLVVKNGSKILDLIPSSIPDPVSVTATAT